MLTKRIIPCLDVDSGRVVKGISFVDLKDAGDPVELAAFYYHQGADEIVFLDITASSEGRGTIVGLVERVSREVFIPLTVGGGVRTTTDIKGLLEAGADKVSINTAAVMNPQLLREASKLFGSQCIVTAIDARITYSNADYGNNNSPFDSELQDIKLSENSRWEVFLHGGRTPTGIDAVKWAEKAQELGAGEILLTSMDADGHLDGFDLALTQSISERLSIPVIASGGAGSNEHIFDVLTKGKADAALAASIYHYGKTSVMETKNFLSNQGVAVRWD